MQTQKREIEENKTMAHEKAKGEKGKNKTTQKRQKRLPEGEKNPQYKFTYPNSQAGSCWDGKLGLDSL